MKNGKINIKQIIMLVVVVLFIGYELLLPGGDENGENAPTVGVVRSEENASAESTARSEENASAESIVWSEENASAESTARSEENASAESIVWSEEDTFPADTVGNEEPQHVSQSRDNQELMYSDEDSGIGEFSDSSVPALEEYLSFRNESLWESHYEKHGIDMGFASMEEYLEAANLVLYNEDTLHKIEAEDGDDVYFLEETGEFVVVSTDGYIRTYFIPDDGIDYFNRQ